jgi:type VI secretion system protein ImpF
MARVSPDQPLIPSVLDRLLSEGGDPEAVTRARTIRDLKQSVRRDLENLLNTRVYPLHWPEHLDELPRSLISYGIPDITGALIDSDERQEDLRASIEQTIRQFEPRLRNVKVSLSRRQATSERTLRFRIEALLRVDPVPEHVTFDSSIEAATGSIEVVGGAG